MSEVETEYGDPDAFYSRYYQQVLCTGIVGSAQARTHKALERHAGPDTSFVRVLEVGAGSGEHFPYVRHQFVEYVETDMREPAFAHPASDARRRFQVADAQALAFDDASFDRLVATCLLLHLPEPECALAEWRRVVRPGGLLSMLVPCNPGALVRLTRELLTMPAVRHSGFQGYKLFNARDHRNHAGAIDRLVRYVFRNDRICTYRYPLQVNSWNLNAFTVYTVARTR